MPLTTVPQALAIVRLIEQDHPDWSWQRTLTGIRKLTYDSSLSRTREGA